MTDAQTPAPLATTVRRALVWAKLRELGIPEVSVAFSGSGDSGQIDGWAVPFASREGDSAEEALARHEATTAALASCMVEVGPNEPAVALTTTIEELSDELLTGHAIPNWWDGEGGHGDVFWIVDPAGSGGRIELTVHVARIEYDTEVFAYDGLTGAAVDGDGHGEEA